MSGKKTIAVGEAIIVAEDLQVIPAPAGGAGAGAESAFRVVALGLLRESAHNPRKHFDSKALADLTASVKEKGILVPLLVRLRTPFGDTTAHTTYEIVAGARRYRAAKAAGLETLPVLVRELDDAQALEVQVIENLQRADVHPLEEAEGYKQLLAKGKYDVDALAAKVGKSASYVYQRLKLAELVPAAKKAFEQEQITAGHAILLARLQPAAQLEALREAEQSRGEFCSVRELASWIHENIHLELKAAPWDLDAAFKTMPAAGSCKECPKRSGANPQLFPDVKEKDVCTDPACFDAKMQAYLLSVQTGLEKSGKRVALITMAHSRQKKEGVLATNDWRLAETNEECKGLAIGLVVEGGWNHREYRRGAQVRICTDKKCEAHWYGEGSSSSYSPGRSPADKKRDRARRRELDRRGLVFKALVEKGHYDQREEETRRLVRWAIGCLDHDHTKRLCEAMGWEPKKGSYIGKDYGAAVQERVAKMKVGDAEDWILYAMIAHEDLFFGAYHQGIPKSELLLQCAQRAKVNIAAIDKAIQAKWAPKAPRKPKVKKRAKAQTSAEKGTCRICGCTEKKACRIEDVLGQETTFCAWADKTKTLCTNPACLQAAAKAQTSPAAIRGKAAKPGAGRKTGKAKQRAA